MQKLFQYVLDDYIDGEEKVDSFSPIFQALTKELPLLIDNYINRRDLLVVGSMGKGRKTSYPWISILNKSITSTTQKGLYIVYLFKKDMSGFYLALSQGITNFENLFKNKKYIYAMKVAKYFASQIENTTFTNKPIVLGDGIHDLGYGYERATVISRFYSSNNFTDQELKSDLLKMLQIYDSIAQHMESSSYNQIIKSVIAEEGYNAIPAKEAIHAIKEALDPKNEKEYSFERRLMEVFPYIDRTNKFKRITNPKVSKTDYLLKTEKDIRNGLIGEELVMWHEIKKLNNLGLTYYAERVKWCSMESDAYGYDIESFEVDFKGNVIPIKIEVKTTGCKLDTEFFISKNELEASKKYKKNYYIYRIYDINSSAPKFYRACGEVEDNFVLDPVSFKAKYKN